MIRRFTPDCHSDASRLTLLAAIITFAGCQSRTPGELTTGQAAPVTEQESQTTPTTPRDLSFEQLNIDLPPDSVYEPWMLPLRIEELTGQRVRLRGFMCAAIFQLHNIREFPLMREKECPYGPGGQAHHVAEVELKAGVTTEFTTDEVCIEGVFRVKPYNGPNGKTWSLYRLEDAVVCR